MLDFLRASEEDKVVLHFKDGHSAGELRPADDAGKYDYRYVVMPMRI